MIIKIHKEIDHDLDKEIIHNVSISEFCCPEMNDLLRIDDRRNKKGGYGGVFYVERGYSFAQKTFWFGELGNPPECDRFVLEGVKYCPYCGEKIEFEFN